MKIKTIGFTLAEVIVTLSIIGVISALLIPSLKTARPDEDKLFFKKGIYTFQSGVNNVLKENQQGYLEHLPTDTEFCNNVAENIHTRGVINCGTSSYANPNFISTDGMRFWGLEGTFDGSTVDIHGKKAKIIYMDRTLKDSEMARLTAGKLRGNDYRTPGLKVYVNTKGKVSISADDTYEMKITQDLTATKN